MNWMLITALALAFGVIIGNLMLLLHLDKLSGPMRPNPDRADTKDKPDKTEPSPPAAGQAETKAADAEETASTDEAPNSAHEDKKRCN